MTGIRLLVNRANKTEKRRVNKLLSDSKKTPERKPGVKALDDLTSDDIRNIAKIISSKNLFTGKELSHGRYIPNHEVVKGKKPKWIPRSPVRK